MLLLCHINSHIIHLFSTSFLFLNFSSPYSKKTKKTLLLPISPFLLLHFLNLSPPSLPLYLSLLSTLPLHFIIFFFLYFDSSSPHFILYKFDIISPIQSIHKNCKYSLSLLSFGGFLFFLITLIKVDVFSFSFLIFIL